MSGLPKVKALWVATIMAVLVLAGQASCTRKRPRGEYPLPWFGFHEKVSGVAEKTLLESLATESAQSIANRIVNDLLAMEDAEIHKVGADLKVNFGALVWDVGVRRTYQAVIVPGSRVEPSRRAIKRLPGTAINVKCQHQTDHIPDLDSMGLVSWPCHMGGAVDVLSAALANSAKPRNCIVFYSPKPTPDFSHHPSAAVRGRAGIYGEIAAFCIDAAQKKAIDITIVALSEVATCIMQSYPDEIGPIRGQPPFRTDLNNVRGVAVYIKYGMADVIDDIGSAFPEGRIAENCHKFSFASSLGLKPVSLCHTALMSAVEREKSSKKRSAPSPQS